MDTMTSQITSLTIVYSTVYSGADQGKHQSSASLAFVRGIHRGRVNSPHKWPVTRKMFPFDDVIMNGIQHTMTNQLLKIMFDTATYLFHWCRAPHICVGNPTIIDSDNGFSSDWHQAITGSNAGIWFIWTPATNFIEILTEIHTSSFKKMHFKRSSANGGHFLSASMC